MTVYKISLNTTEYSRRVPFVPNAAVMADV